MGQVSEQWDLFARMVLPVRVSMVQTTEMRRAFFAGARTMLRLCTEVAPDEVSEVQGVAMLEALHEEMCQYARELAAGKW